MSSDYEYEKYITTPENVMEMIGRFGVAIVPGLLNQEECTNMASGMWNTLETISKTWENPISRDNPISWKNLKKLYPLHSMLLQHWSIGHAQFIWNLRQNPKCAEVFAKIWDCTLDELLVSFDAASFHMPSEVTKTGWHKTTWYHSDQSYVEKGFKCVQSWVTAFDVNDGDATLAFYEGSNNFHSEFGEVFGITDTSNWYKLSTEEQTNFYKDRGCIAKKIRCPKGSMVLWDSRTIHCGVEPLKGRQQSNFRCVAYLCYMPRRLASEKEIVKKIKAFEENRMTTHWPCKVKMFAKMPRTYGGEVPEITPLPRPELNEFGRRLAGYSEITKIKTKRRLIIEDSVSDN